MATSRKSGLERTGTPIDTLLDGLPRLSRYDLQLLGMPVVFAMTVLTHLLVGLPLQAGLGVAGVASAALLADALYFNPPGAQYAHDSTEDSDPPLGQRAD